MANSGRLSLNDGSTPERAVAVGTRSERDKILHETWVPYGNGLVRLSHHPHALLILDQIQQKQAREKSLAANAISRT